MGFTPDQLEVLRAQIMMFRDLKGGTLPRDLDSMRPKELPMHQRFVMAPQQLQVGRPVFELPPALCHGPAAAAARGNPCAHAHSQQTAQGTGAPCQGLEARSV